MPRNIYFLLKLQLSYSRLQLLTKQSKSLKPQNYSSVINGKISKLVFEMYKNRVTMKLNGNQHKEQKRMCGCPVYVRRSCTLYIAVNCILLWGVL
jgi:hypothetical protein